MKSKISPILMGLILILILGAGVVIFLGNGGTVNRSDTFRLQLSLDLDLPDLTQGHYEAWVVFPSGEKLSAGKFKTGGTVDLGVSRNIESIESVQVSIESESDENKIPSGITVLQGNIQGGAGTLIFPIDLESASGTYILATPTDGPDSNETSGIWFVDLSGEELAPSLTLPALSGGWKYEIWIKHNGAQVALGRFKFPDGTDTFSGFSGKEKAPPFPGEDLLFNAPEGFIFPLDLSLGSSTILITIEPELGGLDPTGDSPFTAQPLQALIPLGAEDHIHYPLTLHTEALPSGTVSIKF